VLVEEVPAVIGGMGGLVVRAIGAFAATEVGSGFTIDFDTTRGTGGFVCRPAGFAFELEEVLRAMIAGAAGAFPKPKEAGAFALGCGFEVLVVVVLPATGTGGLAAATLAAVLVGLNVFLSTAAGARTRTGGGGTAGLRVIAAFFDAGGTAGSAADLTRVPVVWETTRGLTGASLGYGAGSGATRASGAGSFSGTVTAVRAGEDGSGMSTAAAWCVSASSLSSRAAAACVGVLFKSLSFSTESSGLASPFSCGVCEIIDEVAFATASVARSSTCGAFSCSGSKVVTLSTSSPWLTSASLGAAIIALILGSAGTCPSISRLWMFGAASMIDKFPSSSTTSPTFLKSSSSSSGSLVLFVDRISTGNKGESTGSSAFFARIVLAEK
jgi:hypothetical protein